MERTGEYALAKEAKELILKYARLPRRRRMRVDKLFEALKACMDAVESEEIAEAIVEIIDPALLGLVDPVGTPAELGAAPDNVVAYQRQIGEAIKKYRIALGMTQEDLAKAAKIPQSHVSRLESGMHMPTAKTIERVAAALKVSPSQIDLLDQGE